MMVVVPTFAKRQEGNPPTVGGTIAGSVASIAIFVSGAVDQPGRVEDSGDSNESSPEEPGPSPDQIEQHIGDDGEEKEMPVQISVIRYGHDIGGESSCPGFVEMLGREFQHPAHVTPPKTSTSVVRIFVLVAISVVLAMNGNP